MNEEMRTVRRTWRRLGLTRAEIEVMADELGADLRAAKDDGVEPQAYLGGDASGVARSWASARGLVRPRFHVAGVMLVAVVVTVPLLFAASYIYVAVTSAYLADLFRPGWDWRTPSVVQAGGPVRPYVTVPVWLFVGWYAVTGMAGVAGVLLAVSAFLRRWADPARAATVRALAVTVLPAAGIAGLVVAGVSKALAGQNGTLAGQLAQYVAFTIVFAGLVGLTRAAVVARDRLAPRRHPEVVRPA